MNNSISNNNNNNNNNKVIIIMKIKLNLFHFDKYALNIENWPVKYFGFQNILYTCNDN